jgi:HMG (high mobility group) box/HMG-box domain
MVNDKDDTLKNVAAEWRKLSDKERAFWDEQAREDKVRFVREKAAYKGTWNIPKRRAKKHPLAPKRPMSAFLKFSKTRRNKVKHDNPTMENTDVSRLLGEMWRNASAAERAPYVESEEKERAEYKEEIKKWRSEQALFDATTRTSHHSAVQNYHQNQQPKPPQPTQHSATFEYSHSGGPPSVNFETGTDQLTDDHSSRRSAFRPHYPNHTYVRSTYRPDFYSTDGHNQQSWPDHPVQHNLEHDSDPLPIVPTRMHPQGHLPNPSNEDYVAGQYASRSNYFSEMPRYSRYI